jgi:hypothetical protein
MLFAILFISLALATLDPFKDSLLSIIKNVKTLELRDMFVYESLYVEI